MEVQAAGTTRRGLLTGGVALASLTGAALLASCGTPDTPSDQLPSGAATTTDPVRERAASAERALIAAYDAALAGGDDPLLRAIRAQHEAHLAALGGGGAAVPTPASTTTADLIALEQEAAIACRDACAAADEPALTRTLAFIAASEASHVPALRART